VDPTDPPARRVPPGIVPPLSPNGGRIRPARRPPGWRPAGPRPALPADRIDLWPGPDEDLCHLAGDWRILQRIDGHRWSADDLVTAALAAECFPGAPPARFVDLGCGIGTVLLLLAWRFPEARGTGIEAQARSADLARRSVALDGAEDRCGVRIGDFRDPALLDGLDEADLVTGTPPYLARGAGTESTHDQKAACRFEHRGGVEDYMAAAARLLSPGAPFVGCAAARQRARVETAAADQGLHLSRWRSVVPREGRAPLFAAFVLRRGPPAAGAEDALCLRDARGCRTEAFRAVRAAMGMPP
jgi:tRNA1(Val) A37 N6-methylase TrmN6